jgi:TatD DNase family protein
MVKRHLPQDRSAVVLRCFTGSRSEARRAAALGCYISVNAQMIRPEHGRTLFADLPLNRIVTETVGPFSQVDGRPPEPADVRAAVGAIAGARNLPKEAVTGAIHTNPQSLLCTCLQPTSLTQGALETVHVY